MPNPDLHFSRVHSRLRSRDGHEVGAQWDDGMVKRAGPAHVVAERVAFRPGLAVKSKQAWKYPGNKIERASDIFIHGRKYLDPKELPEEVPRRKNESNFFITINSNRSYEGAAAVQAQQAFEGALKALTQNEVFAEILKFGPKDQETYGGDNAADVIKHVDWQSNVEIGPNLGRMHSHTWLTIEHYSQVQINVPQLQYYFRTAFNSAFSNGHPAQLTANPYVHIKLLAQSDWTSVMRQYITKAMQTTPN